jgi:hypothetical protein
MILESIIVFDNATSIINCTLFHFETLDKNSMSKPITKATITTTS